MITYFADERRPSVLKTMCSKTHLFKVSCARLLISLKWLLRLVCLMLDWNEINSSIKRIKIVSWGCLVHYLPKGFLRLKSEMSSQTNPKCFTVCFIIGCPSYVYHVLQMVPPGFKQSKIFRVKSKHTFFLHSQG